VSTLKQKLNGGDIIVAPGIYDLISVKLADQMDFDCLYMTGFGSVASYLGLPDAGLASYTDMLNRVSAFCGAAKTPIICDGDTGYGGLLNVAHTVKGYERAGAAGIQLEDQEFPKKCGHTKGRRVTSAQDMVRKIRVAADSRDSADFLIVARTDARTSLGLDEALRRAEQYAGAGADVLFIESPETEQELETIGRSFELPLLVNIVEGGRTPQLPPQRLQELGFSLAIYPASGFLAVAKALESVYASIQQGKGTKPLEAHLYPFEKLCVLMGFQDVWDFDARYAEDQ
jgi:2-methylisocitrate lyase-like PEP mutase family enzyme